MVYRVSNSFQICITYAHRAYVKLESAMTHICSVLVYGLHSELISKYALLSAEKQILCELLNSFVTRLNNQVKIPDC